MRFAFVLPALATLLILSPITKPDALTKGGDAFQFWYAGHLAATGASPYDSSQWRLAGARFGEPAALVAAGCADPEPDAATCNWIYPPLTAWLYAPLGALPVEIGLGLLNLLTLAAAIAGVVSAVILFGPRAPAARALLVAIAVAWHPFVTTVAGSHPIGLLLLGIGAIAWGLRRGTLWPVVAGAVVLMVKPHVALAIAPAVVALLAYRRRWSDLAWLGIFVGAIAAAAVAVAPESVRAMLEHSTSKASLGWWASSAALATSSGIPSAVIGFVAGLAMAVAIVKSWRPRRAVTGIAAAAALSLLVTPYVQPYDYLLALPALAAAAHAASHRSGPVRALVLAAATCIALGSWLTIFVGSSSSSYALVAVLSILLLAAAQIPAESPRSFLLEDVARVFGVPVKILRS